MQFTMLILFAFLTGQATDPTGDRYPDQPAVTSAASGDDSATATAESAPTESRQTEAASSQPDSPASDPATTPAGSQPSVFDEIDAAAQPLSSAPADQPAAATEPPAGRHSAQPSFATQPPASSPAADVDSDTDPAKVLAGFFEPPLEGALSGTQVTLAQAVDSALSRAEQTHRVVTYWDLSQAVANYYLACKERTELAALRQGIGLPATDWETARQSAEARLQLARDRVRVAQESLAALMGNTTPGFAPLPSDLPFCGLYETRYEQLFQSRPSALAQQLNELLPRLHSDLAARTADIAGARKWMFAVSDRRGLDSDGNELLKAYELFATRRRLFMSAVREYNLGIVRYTEIATPGTVETERLVAMLIRTGSSPGTTVDRDVQRAGAEEGAAPNDSSGTAPAAGWGSSKQSSTERSILVPRG